MKPVTFSDRLKYQFDNMMSKGPIALIFWLFAISLVIILVISGVVTALGITQEDGSPSNFGEAMWMSLMRTFDAGTMGADTGTGFRAAMLVVTLGGIFVVSMLIGVLTTGIEGKLDEMRKGRSFIVEKGHIVILGWNDQIFSLISELILANANQKRSCIAILAPKDKVEMEDEIKTRIEKTGKTRIVCRTGSPIDLADLQIANPYEAKSIVVLSPEGENPDSSVIKTILALTNDPKRSKNKLHIVAAIRDRKNIAAARLVGNGEAELILTDAIISRITAQTCRQSGLSVVYQELLDYGGDEIYFYQNPAMVGLKFGEIISKFEDSTVMGIRFADGRTQLNPAPDTRVGEQDKLVVISEDDDTIHPTAVPGKIDQEAIIHARPMPISPEKTLVLGWNHCAPVILKELDNYVTAGSKVTVVAECIENVEYAKQIEEKLEHLEVIFQCGDTTSRELLESLDIPSFNHVILLSYSDKVDAQEADARTLVTLLHLRDLGEKSGHKFSITSEMLDVRNRELADVCKADDFIVSDKLVSLMMSQISETKELAAVFEDMFDPEGSEIYLKPIDQYVQTGKPVNFYTITEAARCRNEVAIGYRLKANANDPEHSYGVHVNPNKSEMVTFGPDDRIVVVAEE